LTTTSMVIMTTGKTMKNTCSTPPRSIFYIEQDAYSTPRGL
jgi:hypothetical protein